MTFKKIVLTTTLFASTAGMSLSASASPSAEVTLQGVITSTTCDVTINGGKSILNVGVFKSADFVANKMLGAVKMPVTLTNCKADETGDLIIQGLTSVANNDQNIFVSNDAEKVGFMIAQDDGKTIVKNGQRIGLDAKEDGVTEYVFTVGMASAAANPEPNAYSAPILISYIVN